MCLIKKHKKHKKATENIEVYKVLVRIHCGLYITPYVGRIVNFNETIYASASVVEGDKSSNIAESGVHAYRTKTAANKALEELRKHGYVTTLFKAIIPAGAFYWEGISEDIASSELIVTNTEL